MYVNKSERFKH